jgi:hypothetical protein
MAPARRWQAGLFQLTLALASTVAPRVSLAASRTASRSACKGAWALRTRSKPSCGLCARARVQMQDRPANKKSSPRLFIKEGAPQRRSLLRSPQFYRIRKSLERAKGNLEVVPRCPRSQVFGKFRLEMVEVSHNSVLRELSTWFGHLARKIAPKMITKPSGMQTKLSPMGHDGACWLRMRARYLSVRSR